MRPTLIEQMEMEYLKELSYEVSRDIMFLNKGRCTHSNGKIRTVIQCDNSIPTNKKQKWVCIKCNDIIESAMEDGGKYIDTPLFK